MVKGISKQSLQALAFLHEQGIVYGDFQPGDRLFAFNKHRFGVGGCTWQREDVNPGSFCLYEQHTSFPTPRKRPVTPLGLRPPPEVVLTV